MNIHTIAPLTLFVSVCIEGIEGEREGVQTDL